jgi:SAM-dependent methyltransferase
VCALALTHGRDLARPIAELARVLRPGGRLIVSDLHPTVVLLGGSGFFVGADGAAGDVASFHHPHGSYLAAFRAAGLEVRDCAEPALGEQELHALSGGPMALAPERFRAAWLGIPNALVWNATRSSAPPR